MTEKERLLALQDKGVYLFHGSGGLIDQFEPRQAHTMIEDEQVADGEPAVFASPFADYAIFMALINEENCPNGFRAGCSYKDGKPVFRATKETLDQLNEISTGYVYVFTRSGFEERSATEWRSFKHQTPIETIKVSLPDLPKEISLIL
jgi:hypothetical protein